MKINIIGIGAGNPAHLTQEAIEAIREVDVFLVADKGAPTSDLVRACRTLVDQYHRGQYQFIEVDDPKRGADGPRTSDEYAGAVVDWHQARADAYLGVVDGFDAKTVVGFLTWGDPAFYDSTIRIVKRMSARIDLEWRVIPGISAFQALAAAHRIVLHEIGQPVHVTTGRRLPVEWRDDLGTVVVMLDVGLHVQELVSTIPQALIYWGAYLGLAHETIRSGPLAETIEELVALRASLRAQHGWIMDVYAISMTPL